MKAMLALALGLGSLSAQMHSHQIRLENHFAPRVDRTDRGTSVRYELRIANHGKEAVSLQGLRVRDVASGTLLLEIGGDRLRAALALGRQGCDVAQGLLSPGGECVLYVDADAIVEAPRTLRNSIAFTVDGSLGQADLDLQVIDDTAPVLGPPLGSGFWVAVHHADWPRGHRRVFYASRRGAVLPGRFAIDFVRVSPDGATSCGDPDRPSDAIGYGDLALAVSDGTIVEARDGVDEATSIRGNRPHEQAMAPGNYIVLAFGRGKFATYEHLRPGSLRVRKGDRVRQGAPLGELGFTGDSTGPHLHFHVSDSSVPLEGEGLPFAFDEFTFLGSYSDIAQLGRSAWQASPAKEMRRVRPGPNSVVSFASAGSPDARPGTSTCVARGKGVAAPAGLR